MRSSALRPVTTLLATAAALLSALGAAPPVRAEPVGTTVGGVVEHDTTWTAAGSPYRVTSTVQVPAGVTLTVEAGVRVEAVGVADVFMMHGTIRVAGTADRAVVIDGASEANVFSGKGARAAVLEVRHAVVQNARALWPATGYEQNGQLVVTDSVLRNLSRYSYLWYPNGESLFARNLITDSAGFSVGTSSGRVIFRDNRFATASRSEAWVQQWAAYGEPTLVTGNTFAVAGSPTLELKDGYTGAKIDAPGNYWSTTDTAVVERMILDSRDSINRAGRIAHEPLLTEPTTDTPAAPVPTLIPVTPERLLDTRADGPPVGYSGQKPTAGQTVRLRVTGRGHAQLPEDIEAVVLNVTGVAGTSHGFLTVWPCSAPRPLAANLNLGPGETSPNLVIAKVDIEGTVCLFTSGGAHLVADLNGFVPAGSDYVAGVPERMLDTRADGPQLGHTGDKPAAGDVVELQVTGRGTAALPADTTAVVLNVTGVDADAHGHVTVWPCGQPKPATANLNLVPRETRPNLVIARVGAGGKVCASVSSGMHLVADLNGWLPSTTSYLALNPSRLLDTRWQGPAPAADQTLRLPVVRPGSPVPASARTVALNVTGVSALRHGFVTVWPCDTPRPLAANLNLAPGQTAPNLVLAKVSGTGEVCLYTSGGAHLVVDLNGYV